ncbi:putative quinol monooxygenase [Granulosicoccus sp. 3-233]|uniref:putative quinol monooxygenase n=1 Tax=Granulosicoccus sp. 3-233 TaxID=3417969 RepID=UPI003D34E07D
MALEDTVCSLVPYFTVQEGKMDEFRRLGEQMVERTRDESEVINYGFSFNGRRAHCRESYTSAAGILAHLGNVDSLLQEALKIASLDILEIHGPADQLAELQEPLKSLNPAYFTMDIGFRR